MKYESIDEVDIECTITLHLVSRKLSKNLKLLVLHLAKNIYAQRKI